MGKERHMVKIFNKKAKRPILIGRDGARSMLWISDIFLCSGQPGVGLLHLQLG